MRTKVDLISGIGISPIDVSFANIAFMKLFKLDRDATSYDLMYSYDNLANLYSLAPLIYKKSFLTEMNYILSVSLQGLKLLGLYKDCPSVKELILLTRGQINNFKTLNITADLLTLQNSYLKLLNLLKLYEPFADKEIANKAINDELSNQGSNSKLQIDPIMRYIDDAKVLKTASLIIERDSTTKVQKLMHDFLNMVVNLNTKTFNDVSTLCGTLKSYYVALAEYDDPDKEILSQNIAQIIHLLTLAKPAGFNYQKWLQAMADMQALLETIDTEFENIDTPLRNAYTDGQATLVSSIYDLKAAIKSGVELNNVHSEVIDFDKIVLDNWGFDQTILKALLTSVHTLQKFYISALNNTNLNLEVKDTHTSLENILSSRDRNKLLNDYTKGVVKYSNNKVDCGRTYALKLGRLNEIRKTVSNLRNKLNLLNDAETTASFISEDDMRSTLSNEILSYVAVLNYLYDNIPQEYKIVYSLFGFTKFYASPDVFQNRYKRICNIGKLSESDDSTLKLMGYANTLEQMKGLLKGFENEVFVYQYAMNNNIDIEELKNIDRVG